MSTAPPDSVLPSELDQRGMDRRLATSIAWSASGRWTTQLLSWLSWLIVARLLAPSDYGIVGIATVYVGFVTVFSDFGLGTAVLVLRDLTRSQVNQLNTLAVLAGVAALVISCAVAVPLGRFFHAPEVPWVIVVMSAGFVVSAFRVVPLSLLQKDMRFKLIAFIEAAQAVAQTAAVLLLAVLGFRYWALVLGGLVGTGAAGILPLIWQRCGFEWPVLPSIRSAIKFSWHVAVTSLSWYTYSNADFLVAGRVLGEAPLGAYTLAWNLASVPVEKLTTLVGRVSPAFFSAVQGEQAALRRYLNTLTQGLSLVTFPATIGLALVAPEFVGLVLGRKWDAAIVPLQLLAMYACLRSIVTLLPQVLLVVKASRFLMWVTVLMLVFLPPTFYVGRRWGTGGIAAGWVIVYPLLTVPLFWRVLQVTRMPARDYLNALRPALEGSILMCAAVLLLKWAIPASTPLYLRFSVEVAAGVAAYALTLVAFHRARLRAFAQFARLLRN
jgi:PST family polysaccharide transporter